MKKFTIGMAARLSLCVGIGVFCAEGALAFGRVDHTQFHIFTSVSGGGVNHEAAIKAVADCGIDTFCAQFNREGLDLCSKYGLKAIVRRGLPYWWGGLGKPGEMAAKLPLADYEKALAEYPDHPAIVAFEFADEPSALDFEHCGKIAAIFNRRTGNYLNLFPSYASAGSLRLSAALSQLGANSYEEYIALYCKHVPVDEICFDNYLYGWTPRADKLYENLRIVADACLASRKSLVVEVQAKTYSDKRPGEPDAKFGPKMTRNRLRCQCNAALAFGARQINWINFYCGWWVDHIMNNEGEIVNRPLYDDLKCVNSELRRQGDVLVKYERTHTDFVDFDCSSNGLERVKQLSVPMSSGAAFVRVKALDEKPLLVGHFVSRAADGKYAACVMAADDPMDEGEVERMVCFSSFRQKIEAIGPDGPVELTKVGEHKYVAPIRSNRALVLLAP